MKALIFDFDGTMLATEDIILSAWQHTYSEYGCSLPIALWQKRVGTMPENFDPIKYLEHMLGTTLDHEKITSTRRAKLAELIPNLNPLPGVQSWLSEAQDLGMRIAIASGSPRTWICNHLERIGFLRYFEEIISIEDIKTMKPNPEIYHLALEKVKVKASEAIAVEDSPSGALAAITAGLKCVVVPNKITVNLNFPITSYFMKNLEECSLKNYINTVC